MYWFIFILNKTLTKQGEEYDGEEKSRKKNCNPSLYIYMFFFINSEETF